MNKINFTLEDIEKCEEFASKVNTSLYAQRNQFDADKRKKDAKIGKLGELAVYYSLKDKYPNITYPDFKIYTAKEKSWDFDLKDTSFNLHVKTQDIVQGAKYGESWIFQHGGGQSKHYDKEIFDMISPNQYVSFVCVDLLKNEGYVKAIVKLNFLHEEKLFSLPKLFKLQNANKLAVYYKDLEKYPDQLNAL